jgi:hypothetical protein
MYRPQHAFELVLRFDGLTDKLVERFPAEKPWRKHAQNSAVMVYG